MKKRIIVTKFQNGTLWYATMSWFFYEEDSMRKYLYIFSLAFLPNKDICRPTVKGQLGEKHSLSYTYSRRLDRPGYKSLNPFEYYLDEYTFERGNPFLNPQYSHNFGLNYSLGNALFVSANYSHTTDAISEIIEQNEEENTTFKTEMNLDDFRSYSLNVMAPKVWTEWFTSRLSYTSFLNEFNSTFSEGDIDKGRLSHVIFLGNEFSLPNGLNLELSGNYQSKLVYGIFELDPRWQGHCCELGVW